MRKLLRELYKVQNQECIQILFLQNLEINRKTLTERTNCAAKRPAAWNSPLNSSIGCTLKKFAELLISYIIVLNILFYHLTAEFYFGFEA